MWLAGGGVKPGVYGQTDEYCYNVTADSVHVHDLNARIMRLMGIDHMRLTCKFQGRYYRLTDVAGTVFEKMLASGGSYPTAVDLQECYPIWGAARHPAPTTEGADRPAS